MPAETPAADPVTLALFEIKARGYRNDASGALAARLSDCAAIDVPRLLAAVESVLKLADEHEPKFPSVPTRKLREAITRELLGEET